MKNGYSDLLSATSVYFATVIGVLFSKHILVLISTGDISTVTYGIPAISEIISAFLLGAFIIALLERKPKDVDAVIDKAGKRKRIVKRLLNAFVHGAMWFQFAQSIIQGIRNGVI